MTEYSSAINLAARLIIKKGREVVFSHRETTPAAQKNPDRPQDKEAPLEGCKTLRMVFLDYEQKFVNGTDIIAGDKQVYMFAKGVNWRPTKKDKIYETPKNGGEMWNIMGVETVRPGEEDVLYILQVRR